MVVDRGDVDAVDVGISNHFFSSKTYTSLRSYIIWFHTGYGYFECDRMWCFTNSCLISAVQGKQ